MDATPLTNRKLYKFRKIFSLLSEFPIRERPLVILVMKIILLIALVSFQISHLYFIYL